MKGRGRRAEGKGVKDLKGREVKKRKKGKGTKEEQMTTKTNTVKWSTS